MRAYRHSSSLHPAIRGGSCVLVPMGPVTRPAEWTSIDRRSVVIYRSADVRPPSPSHWSPPDLMPSTCRVGCGGGRPHGLPQQRGRRPGAGDL